MDSRRATDAEPGERGRSSYHHGDLKETLMEVTVELIAERGLQGFSLAEASRCAGVSVSAPYRHFADRDALLTAVGVRATAALAAALAAEVDADSAPEQRLSDAAAALVRFAAAERPLFELLTGLGAEKDRLGELQEASRAVAAVFLEPALTMCGDEPQARELSLAVVAVAYGHATLLLQGAYGEGVEASGGAATRAARVTSALVRGRAAFLDLHAL